MKTLDRIAVLIALAIPAAALVWLVGAALEILTR